MEFGNLPSILLMVVTIVNCDSIGRNLIAMSNQISRNRGCKFLNSLSVLLTVIVMMLSFFVTFFLVCNIVRVVITECP